MTAILKVLRIVEFNATVRFLIWYPTGIAKSDDHFFLALDRFLMLLYFCLDFKELFIIQRNRLSRF